MVRRLSAGTEQYPHPIADAFSIGLVLSLQLGGRNPVHPCATVFYPGSCKTWDIAESLIEVVYEIGEATDVL